MAESESDDLMELARKQFQRAEDEHRENRERFIEDVEFARAGNQWPSELAAQREREGRPALTINRMPSFIRQVVNDARQNKPAIKAHPVDDKADRETADVISGLIRNIERTSNADTAYDTAIDNAASGNVGYIRITADYAYDDSFDLDLKIERVVDPLSIYPDPDSTSADGSDWNVCFVVERHSKERFEEEWGDKAKVDWDHALWRTDTTGRWFTDEGILVAEWWTREKVPGKAYQLSNGVVTDDEGIADPDIAVLLETGELQIVRERPITRHKVTQRFITGHEVLETNEWPGKWIPVVPVYGEEFWLGDKRHLRSLIHDAKDPQRMHNFWRTNATELVALAPRVPWIGEAGVFDPDPAGWQTSNTVSHPYLEYKKGRPPPVRQPLDTGAAAGSLQEALNATDDMKSVMGIYDASLGARSNETSGRAILARQREGDISTFHFIDNLSRGIRQVGQILLDLIPAVYSGPRIVRVLGEDDSERAVQINQPFQPVDEEGNPQQDERGEAILALHDMSAGKYDLTVTAGPSFTTRREEAAYQMTEFVRAYPNAAPVIGDLIAKNSDWPDADTVSERLEALLPPPARDQIPPEVLMLQQQAQATAQELEALKVDKTLEVEKLKIERYKAETDRLKVQADIAAKADEQDMTTLKESINGQLGQAS